MARRSLWQGERYRPRASWLSRWTILLIACTLFNGAVVVFNGHQTHNNHKSMAQGTLSATRNKLAAEKDASKESGGLPNSGVQIRPPGSEVQTQAPDSGVRILPPDNDVEILPDTSEEVLFPPSKPGRTMQESPNKETQTHKEEKTPGAELQKTMDSSKNKGILHKLSTSGAGATINVGVQRLLNVARMSRAVEERLSSLKAKGVKNLIASTEERKSRPPDKPFLWNIYEGTPPANRHMEIPSAKESMLPKDQVDEMLASGTIWGITSFFNPEGYQNKLDNFRLFRERVTFGQGLPLVVVELGFGTNKFQLKNRSDAEVLIQRRSSIDNVLWQKERMLNVALKHLPPNCTQVVWMDADTFFTNKNWVKETSKKLEKHVIVQPFAWLVRLPPDTLWMNPADVDVSMKWEEGGLVPFRQIYFSAGFMIGTRGLHHMVYHLILDDNDHEVGHCGIAWAAQRWLLDKHKFYDKFIAGGADNVMFQAMLGHFRPMMRSHLSTPLRHNVTFWANRFYRDVRGKVSYTDGVGLTMWHGHRKNRGYSKRYDVLLENKFDPTEDIAVDNATEAWVWASNKTNLHQQMREYFSRRVEETVDWREYMEDAYHAPSSSGTQEMTKEEKLATHAFATRQKKLNKHVRALWQDYRAGVSYGREHKRSQDTVTGLYEIDI